MSKINNTQRAGLVRQLQEVKKKLETSGRSWYSYSKYSGYSGDDNPEAKRVVSQLEEKYQIPSLKREERRIEEALTKAISAIEEGLKQFNADKETERQEKIKALSFGIRDIWATETMEEAKKIVSVLVE